MSENILIELKDLKDLFEIELKQKIRDSTCQEILKWWDIADFKVDIAERKLVVEDLQETQELRKFNVLDFITYWTEDWKCRYDFSKNSNDRFISGNEFIDKLIDIIKEIDCIKLLVEN